MYLFDGALVDVAAELRLIPPIADQCKYKYVPCTRGHVCENNSDGFSCFHRQRFEVEYR